MVRLNTSPTLNPVPPKLTSYEVVVGFTIPVKIVPAEESTNTLSSISKGTSTKLL